MEFGKHACPNLKLRSTRVAGLPRFAHGTDYHHLSRSVILNPLFGAIVVHTGTRTISTKHKKVAITTAISGMIPRSTPDTVYS